MLNEVMGELEILRAYRILAEAGSIVVADTTAQCPLCGYAIGYNKQRCEICELCES